MCYFHPFLYRRKRGNPLYRYSIFISSVDNEALHKRCLWFTIIYSGCELHYSAKKHSCSKTAVSIHGRLEETCCFTRTSHITLKALNPWSLFQWWGPPAWGHDWAEFQISFPYHTGMDENPVTVLELYQIFVTSYLGTWLFRGFVSSTVFSPLSIDRTCIGLLHCQVHRQLPRYRMDHWTKNV